MNRHMEEGRQMSNEIVNYNPGQASLLDMREDASRFPRIKTMPIEQVKEGLSRIVSQAFLYRGQAADPTNIQFISSSLAEELLEEKRFGAAYLSLADIQVVVKRAILSTDMFGISVASLYRVIIDYAKGEGHNNQMIVWGREKSAPSAKSAVSTMLQAETGKFIKSHKV